MPDISRSKHYGCHHPVCFYYMIIQDSGFHWYLWMQGLSFVKISYIVINLLLSIDTLSGFVDLTKSHLRIFKTLIDFYIIHCTKRGCLHIEIYNPLNKYKYCTILFHLEWYLNISGTEIALTHLEIYNFFTFQTQTINNENQCKNWVKYYM